MMSTASAALYLCAGLLAAASIPVGIGWTVMSPYVLETAIADGFTAFGWTLGSAVVFGVLGLLFALGSPTRRSTP